MSTSKLSHAEERFIWQHRYDLPATQIALDLGRTRSTVYAYLKKWGISTRHKDGPEVSSTH
ncbi:MAG: hypothetical protein IJ169_04445 [Paludibacteraceae bacterium]|nr:hypothetical protein [Paludibacteraceae bacterium]